MRLSNLLALALFVPFAAACAGGGDDGKTGDDQNVVGGAHLGHLHDFCGGIGGLRCASGLECQLHDHAPFDAGGTCETASNDGNSGTPAPGTPAAGEDGALCGGFAGLHCSPGFECKMSGASHPDQSGQCKKLTCPEAGASINCMPPTTNKYCGANRSWVQDNCPGISFLD